MHPIDLNENPNKGLHTFLRYFHILLPRYVPSVDGQWGSLIDPNTQTWNGMVGMVQRKVKYDLSVLHYLYTRLKPLGSLLPKKLARYFT